MKKPPRNIYVTPTRDGFALHIASDAILLSYDEARTLLDVLSAEREVVQSEVWHEIFLNRLRLKNAGIVGNALLEAIKRIQTPR